MNPDFTFFAGEDLAPVQAPWEFKSAAKEARSESSRFKTTSVDEKIRQHLSNKAGRGRGRGRGMSAMGRGGFGAGRGRGAGSDSDAGSEYDSDDGDGPEGAESDSEGEEAASEDDEEDDMGMEVEDEGEEGEDEGGGEEGDAEEDEEDDDEDDEEGGEGQGKGRAGRREAAPRQRAVDEDEDSSSDEDDDAPARPAKSGGGGGGDARKGDKFFGDAPDDTTFNAAAFSDLNISRPLLKACEALGYGKPTPIQAACIPIALTGRDVCGSAMTGSGKTAAFALPVLERLLYRPRRVAYTRVLILTPTRELAVQVHSMTQKLAQFTDVSSALVVGGLSLSVQAAVLRKRPDIVVATPGRLIDHLRNTQSVGLEELSVLVLDEADRLLEMGFKEELHEIVKMCPRNRQTLLFSATMTEEVKNLASLSLKKPVRLSADAAGKTPVDMVQEVVRLKGGHGADKEPILLALCSRTFKEKCIVFSRTKEQSHRLKILFGLCGLKAAELHGNLSQAQRLEALEDFRSGAAKFLIATDVAARGLDILGVQTVINFDAPATMTNYVHRVGRTARAGRQGSAITFVDDKDRNLLKDVMKKSGGRLQSRAVPAGVVAEWRAKLESLNSDLRDVVQMERTERSFRKAEMEADKAENLVTHAAEIYSRPARTWFQSEKEKKAERERVKEHAGLGEGKGGGKGKEEGGKGKDGRAGKESKQSGKEKEKSRKRGEMDAEEEGDRRKKEKYGGGLKGASREDLDDLAKVQAGIKGMKAKQRQLKGAGARTGTAWKVALEESGGPPPRKKAKAGHKGEGGLFSGDGSSRGPGAGGGEKRGPKARSHGVKSFGKKGGTGGANSEKAAARKGAGHKAFKSASKFKRKR